MKQDSRRFFLIVCLLLSSVLATVILTVVLMARVLQTIFVPYQFFLVGICVGALAAATLGLIIERREWAPYQVYFVTVMVSVFLLAAVNSVIFKLLGGEQFIRRIIEYSLGRP
jgi:hypothetical protein